VARDDIVVATKFAPVRDGVVVAPDDVVQSVESSLRLLRVEQLDLLQFHGLLQPHCGEVLDRLWPTVAALRERGRCRWVGVTESYKDDPAHGMLERVLHRPPFDTAMVGYNLMSQTAESVVLPRCIDEQIGVIGMVPVRRALGDPDRLRACLRDAAERGVIAAGELPEADPLGWLVTGEVESVPAAAYKFASAHPAVATVLTGTSRVEHLEQNVRAVTGPPLPDEHMARLRRVFGHVREALAN
jgi:aryl-alcohol dehydrogenase-like predicted oxidoreductase